MPRLVIKNLSNNLTEEKLRETFGHKIIVTDVNVELVFSENHRELNRVALIDFIIVEEFKLPSRDVNITRSCPDLSLINVQSYTTNLEGKHKSKFWSDTSCTGNLNQPVCKSYNNHQNVKNREEYTTKKINLLEQSQKTKHNGTLYETVNNSKLKCFPNCLNNFLYEEGQCRYENKKNESDYADCKNNEEENICQLCDEVQQPEDETIKNGFQHEELKGAQKLPKYFDNLSYAEGQWRATNSSGKKVYSKPFLLQLCCESICQKKPHVLENWKQLINHNMQHSSLGKSSSSVTNDDISSKWSFSNSACAFTNSNTFAAFNNKKVLSSKNPSRKPVISESKKRQRMMSGVTSMMMPQFSQVTSLFNSTTSSQISKDTVEEPTPAVELDPEVANRINLQCKNIIQEYEQMHNLDDIIYSLVEDEKSSIRSRHKEFVKSMSLITLDRSPNSRTEAGKLFAELLSKKVLSMLDITQGINNVLQDWVDQIIDYPQFFSYIAAIITPLLLSKTASFDFNNLKDACASIRPDNSSVFFNEILQKILSSKETRDMKENGGILWIYNKWRMSDYVPLDTFMPVNQLNKYFKNDRVGVFLLSMAMYDKMRLTDCKLLYDIMRCWISTNIKEEIIKCPQFVRALTIAIVIVCLKPNNSYEEFFDHVFVKLLTCYICSEPLPEPEIQAREVQCLYGIQLMSAALQHPGGMVLKLFHKLYQGSVISKESFELWKNENDFKAGFDEDLKTKTMAVVVLNSFFVSLSVNEPDEDKMTDSAIHKNARVSTVVKKTTNSKNKNEELKTKEAKLNIPPNLNVNSPDKNFSSTEHFKPLPIATIDRLEETIDNVFDKISTSKLDNYLDLCYIDEDKQMNNNYKDFSTSKINCLNVSKRSDEDQRNSKEIATGFSCFEKPTENFLKISNENESAENEIDYFCISLAIHLKTMPHERVLICQKKIQKIMDDECLFQYTQ